MDNQQFQNELQNILNDMLYENIWTNQNRIPRNNAYYRRNNERDNIYLLQCLREVMQAYNENMRDYTTNVRLYLQLMDLIIRQEMSTQSNTPIIEQRRERTSQRTSERPRARTRTQTQTEMPQFLSYMIYPIRDASGNIGTQRQRQNFQDVIVRPTIEQFNQATRSFIYNDEVFLSNHRCPISLEDFVEGDAVRQIIHCGHAFSEESIQNWFQSNVRCPVCRYDIRQSNTTQTQDVSGNDISSAQTQNNIDNIINGLTANISSIINNYVNPNMETENNDIVYNFEIPIYYNDLSGNSN